MNPITWNKSPYNEERGEFERLTKERTPLNANAKTFKDNNEYLKKAYTNAKMVTLTDFMWRKLGNTDSWTTDTLRKVYDAFKRNNEYRSVGNILTQFESGKVNAPIVIQFADKSMELVAGNTRLMMAKILGITPKVYLIESDW
jgi:hypothetical protein